MKGLNVRLIIISNFNWQKCILKGCEPNPTKDYNQKNVCNYELKLAKIKIQLHEHTYAIESLESDQIVCALYEQEL